MAKAKTAVDVILGEAGGKTARERFNDMKAIASVISNRAKALGVSVKDVIGVQSEFNAFGKSLPKGVERYRQLAERAMKEVEETGPIHTATFYATPTATGNLPKGLKKEVSTAGHVYFSDPKQRSIKTAQGFSQPSGLLSSYAATNDASAFNSVLNKPADYSSPFGLLGDRITSDFGARARPRTSLGLGSANHGGVDMSLDAGVSGYPVEAAAGGIVSFAGPKRGYGNMVEITHPDGMMTRYGHLKNVGNIAIGDEVARGTPVGLVGNTGRSKGPHLHFETIDNDGKKIDPRSVVSFNQNARVPTPLSRPSDWQSATPIAVERRALKDVSPTLTGSAERGVTPSAEASGLLSYRAPEDMASLQARANLGRQQLEARNGSLNLTEAQTAAAMKRREAALGLLAERDPIAAIEKISPTAKAPTTSLATGYRDLERSMAEAGVLGLSGQKVLDSSDILGVGNLAKPVGALAVESMPTTTVAGVEGPATAEVINTPQVARRTPQAMGGLLSPDETTAVAEQRARLEAMGKNRTAQLGAALKKGAGGFGGGILGGLVAGPLGAVVGGLLGNTLMNGNLFNGTGTNYFPDAPTGGLLGDGKETDYGRSVRQSSGQYDRAVRSGAKGLY